MLEQKNKQLEKSGSSIKELEAQLVKSAARASALEEEQQASKVTVSEQQKTTNRRLVVVIRRLNRDSPTRQNFDDSSAQPSPGQQNFDESPAQPSPAHWGSAQPESGAARNRGPARKRGSAQPESGVTSYVIDRVTN